MRELEVCLNDKDWLPINANSCDYIYKDTMPLLLIIIDEMSELTTKGNSKTPEGKEEDMLKDEIVYIMKSIAQLGRAGGIHLITATQSPYATIIPSDLRNNLGFRVFAGRAKTAGMSTATLGDGVTIATTVDTEHPGLSVANIEGNIRFFRGYYIKEVSKELENYYAQRGLDLDGYSEIVVEDEMLDDLDGNIEIEENDDVFKVDFENESIELDQRKNQNWREI